jgi:DNA-binding NtrC family response regulator
MTSPTHSSSTAGNSSASAPASLSTPALDQSSGRLLIADDQADVRAALQLLLKMEGLDVTDADSPQRVLELVQQNNFDLVLIDLNYARDTTSGREGIELLARLRAVDDTLPIVVMTAWGSIELAVDAMRRGARDFVQKPWENERLLSILRTQIALGRALRGNRRSAQHRQLVRQDRGSELIGKSPVMREVIRMIQRIGPAEVPVLITGENGTGKGVVARLLHDHSPRAQAELVVVNAAGLAPTLFESELFGHAKGAFTDARSDRPGRFELADGGTLFLDEIGSVPLALQPKLLRVVETGQFERVGSNRTQQASVRLISATNADLREEVRSGRFRQDLLFRLNTIEIPLPPLRERGDDVILLAEHFLRCHAARYHKPDLRLDGSAATTLMRYPWPGNVRELDHCIERAVLLADRPKIQGDDLLPSGRLESAQDRDQPILPLAEIERRAIIRALARCDNNIQRAAQSLGLSRSGFYRRLQRHGIDTRGPDAEAADSPD